MQVEETGFLRRVHGEPLRDNVWSCQFRKAWMSYPLLKRESSAALIRPRV